MTATSKTLSATRAANIAASWTRPDVAARRSERTGVIVNGVPFASVPEAFAVLGLPGSHMVKTRLAVKAAGVFEYCPGVVFKVAA